MSDFCGKVFTNDYAYVIYFTELCFYFIPNVSNIKPIEIHKFTQDNGAFPQESKVFVSGQLSQNSALTRGSGSLSFFPPLLSVTLNP